MRVMDHHCAHLVRNGSSEGEGLMWWRNRGGARVERTLGFSSYSATNFPGQIWPNLGDSSYQILIS